MSRYITKANRCDCHPETCNHFDWYTFDTKSELPIGFGSDIQTRVDEQTARLNAIDETVIALLPKLNIRCDYHGCGGHGTTYLNVVRVEKEDDDSFTAVSNDWPLQLTRTNPEGTPS